MSDPIPNLKRHGTRHGYEMGCRCDDCGFANTEDQAKYRKWGGVDNVPATGEVTIAEFRDWVRSLGFEAPWRMGTRKAVALIARWNREHPDRPFNGAKL